MRALVVACDFTTTFRFGVAGNLCVTILLDAGSCSGSSSAATTAASDYQSDSPRPKVGVPERRLQVSKQLASQPIQRGVLCRLGVLWRRSCQAAEAPSPLQ